MNTKVLHLNEKTTSTAHRLAYYDEVCSNIHGHNITWDVTLVVDMDATGPENMPVDFKTVDDLIDEVDHATLLNENDPMVSRIQSFDGVQTDAGAKQMIGEVFGDVVWFESDPTCEMVSDWMARRLVTELDNVIEADICIAETDKYSVHGHFPKEEHVPQGQQRLEEVDGDGE